MFESKYSSPSRLLTAAVLIVSLVVIAYAVFYRSVILWNPTTIGSLLVIPALISATSGWLMIRAGSAARINFLISAAGIVAALYIGELLLIAAGPYITLPKSYDRRTTLEVVMDMRRSQSDVFPSVHPKQLTSVNLQVGAEQMLPLSGIPEVTTVFCNETGEYYIYQADEYGFTNPKGSFSQPAKILLVGDSFTQGFCNPGGRSFADLIRREIPRTVNIGSNGNGPLVELAGLREYLPGLSPRHVFWFYFEGNDIEDLSREIEHPILRRYLVEAAFSQKLTTRVPEYGEALRDFVESRYAEELSITSNGRRRAKLRSQFDLWSKLWHTRALLGLTDFKRIWPMRYQGSNTEERALADAFDSIMRSAQQFTDQRGAELVFVYLPSFRTFGYQIDHPWRERVLRAVSKYQIPIIDLHLEFEKLPDPVGMYNFRKEAHYTDAGNAMVAKAVLDYLGGVDSSLPRGAHRP